ncbi:MAG: ArsR family transcriptional regulator [Candidatus Poseidoniales archaeon]|nr:ArsR family transcriptional regulator [Candidatus Poseidoniales archaeon]|tara:strand:- start:5401 stop:6249 length:849 start_codon:yes stop_codon:yes gene_type:complete
MDGVSAVRAYTLIAVLALLAGGWMLNEAPTQEIEDDKQLLFGDTDALPASTEEQGGDDDSPELRRGGGEEESDGFVYDLPTSLVAGGGAALGSLALGSFLFEAMRVTVLIALATPLLARMKANRDDMLTRGRILGYLEANAGIHFSALRDALGLANGVSAYHLHTLEGQGEVISWRDGKLRRYAVSSLTKEELSRIRNPIAGTRLAILEVLSDSGQLGLKGSEIRTKLQISRQLLSHHLSELRSSELVEAASDSRRPNWRLSSVGLAALINSRDVARLEAAG